MTLTRRTFIAAGASALATPAIAAGNMSGFRNHQWQTYFRSLNKGAIIVDLAPRVMFFWAPGGKFFKVYPVAVPRSREFARTGRTSITAKRPNPTWRPTPRMLRENPDWPREVPPGPNNPLGTRAMNLGWPAYLIHGTHDDNKIGRRSSSGCIGHYNHNIEEIYSMTPVGCPVMVL